MEYAIGELVCVVQWLSEKYTSKERSSIRYQEAEKMMHAVVYCIEEYQKSERQKARTDGTELVLSESGGEKLSAQEAYERGYDAVVHKTRKALQLYQLIMRSYEDYGCMHYRDTVAKGMREFFLHYDARFAPFDHLLLLDYPVRNLPSLLDEYEGIDLIYEYLLEIRQEQRILGKINRERIIAALRREVTDYEQGFMGNLLELMLA